MKKLFVFRGYVALAAVLAVVVGMFTPFCSMKFRLSEKSVEHLEFLTEKIAEVNPEKKADMEEWNKKLDLSLELSDKYTDEDRKKFEAEILEIEAARLDNNLELNAIVDEYIVNLKIKNEYLSKVIVGASMTEEERALYNAAAAKLEELEKTGAEKFKTVNMTDQDKVIELYGKATETNGYTVKISLIGALVNIRGIIKSFSVLDELSNRDGLIETIEKMVADGESESHIRSYREKLEESEQRLDELSSNDTCKGIATGALEYAVMYKGMSDIGEFGKYSDKQLYPINWSVMYRLAYTETTEQTAETVIARVMLMFAACLLQIVVFVIAIVIGIISLVGLKDLDDAEKFSTDQTANLRRAILLFGLTGLSAIMFGGSPCVGFYIAGAFILLAGIYNLVTFILGGYFGKLSKNEKILFILARVRCFVVAALGGAILLTHLAASENAYINNLLFASIKTFNLTPADFAIVASAWQFLSVVYGAIGMIVVMDMLMAFGGISNKKDSRGKVASALSYGIFALVFAVFPLALHFIEPVLYSYRMTEMILMVVLFVVALGFKIAESRFGLEKERIIQLADYSVYPEKKFVGFMGGSSQLG